MRIWNLIAISVSIALLGACNDGGSGSSNDDGGSSDSKDVQYGTFIDSPVEGLKFETDTQSGMTDPEGTFSYLDGENVSFSLGGTVFPEVLGSGKITPMTLYAPDDANNTAVVNMLRLLQSLDSDGDPENGITISPEVSISLASISLDPASENFEEEANTVLAPLQIDLISEEAALSHFVQGQPYQPADLIGAWFEMTATLPVRTSQSPIDVMDYDLIRYNIDSNGYAVEEDHETEAILDDDPFWLSINKEGQILNKETEDGEYSTNAARLSYGKDKIAFVARDDGDEPESEFGLMIKLAEQYNQNDLTGNWYSLGMELPKKGEGGQSDLPMVYIDKIAIGSEGDAELTEMFVDEPESEQLKFVLKDNGNVSLLDVQVPIGSVQDENNDGWQDEGDLDWLYLSRSKDVMLLGDVDDTLWGFVTLIKQASEPKLSDFEGTWTLYSVEIPPVGSMEADDFAYHIDTLVIDTKGIISGEHLTDSGDQGDGAWTSEITLNNDGLFIQPDKLNQELSNDNFNIWVINESRDFMMNVYSISEIEQSYSIAVRTVTTE
jgi:hypothetical protein